MLLYTVNEGPASKSEDTTKKDIRCLGQIFSRLLSQQAVDNVLSPCSRHLIQSMSDLKDECVPPSEAIFYHPFFWSHEEVVDFLLVAGDFYEENFLIDKCFALRNSLPQHETENIRLMKINRESIEEFSKLVGLIVFITIEKCELIGY